MVGKKDKHAVAIVANYKGKILLGKKRSDSPKFLAGQWHIPGESIEGDESDKSALVRGLLEEAGNKIKIKGRVRYIGSSITPTSKKQIKWYECFVDTDEVTAGSDLEEVKWVDRYEVLNHVNEEVQSLWPEQIKFYFRNQQPQIL